MKSEIQTGFGAAASTRFCWQQHACEMTFFKSVMKYALLADAKLQSVATPALLAKEKSSGSLQSFSCVLFYSRKNTIPKFPPTYMNRKIRDSTVMAGEEGFELKK